MDKEKMAPIKARESKGVKQGYMAKVLGIARQSLGAKEHGRVSWSYDEAERFCKELNIPMSRIDFSLPKTFKKSEHLERKEI